MHGLTSLKPSKLYLKKYFLVTVCILSLMNQASITLSLTALHEF